MSSLAPSQHEIANWSTYNDNKKQHGSSSISFDPEIIWSPAPTGRGGYQRTFSDAVTQSFLIKQVLYFVPLRHTMSFVQSVLHMIGLDQKVSAVSALFPARVSRTRASLIPAVRTMFAVL